MDGAPSTDSFNTLARGRRPSIAPVPAMFGQASDSEEEDSQESADTPKDQREEDEEKYLEKPWITPAENCE